MNDRARRAHVSDLLAPFVREELSADERAQVEGHLDDCIECREELSGLRLLMSAGEVKLDELERARLHSVVAQGLDPTEAPEGAPPDVWLPPRKSVWSRFAPTLGAAALLLIAVIAGLTFGGGETGDDSGGSAERAVEDVGGGGGGEGSAAGDKGGADQPKPEAAPVEEGSEQAGELETTDTRSDGRVLDGPDPRFFDLGGTLSEASAKKADDDAFVDAVSMNYWKRYARGLTVRDARRFEQDALLRLKDNAPDDIRGRVNWCASRVLNDYDEPLLAAYGSLGEIESARTLILGFVYSERDKGPLDRYIVRSWNSCAGSFRHLEGPIEN